MNVQTYLARIGYDGPLNPTYPTLRALQVAHMHTVPFENLDIVPLHRPIRLDAAALWDKIIVRKRGGFCYELNGMFAWLLGQAGFRVRYLNARVFNGEGKLGMDFDHLALLVDTMEDPAQWLADVGFGDSFEEPLPLREGEQEQGSRAYRLEQNAGGYMMWQRDYAGSWKREYFFDTTPHSYPAEYKTACEYHQRSPESTFTRGPVISRATDDGRVTLTHDMLIRTRNGERVEQPVTTEEWPRLLSENFGVVI